VGRNNYYRFKARHLSGKRESLVETAEILRAREDLNAFTQYVSGFGIGCKFHETWAQKWATGQSNDLLNKIAGPPVSVLAPRSSAKSTRVGYAIAWAIGHNPGIPILYLSYKEGIALSRSRLIKRIITNPRYREVFPHIRPNKNKWNDREWEIDKPFAGVSDLEYDHTLYATGIDGGIVSKRSWLIVVDDPIKNKASISNPDVRQKIRENWRSAALPTLLAQGRIWSIGTRFHRDDIHVTDLNATRHFEVLEQSAIQVDDAGNESSYWEEMAPFHSRELLFSDGTVQVIEGLYEKRENDSVTFAFQYENKVVSEYDVAIAEDWIKWTEDIPDPELIEEYAFGVDLAARERESTDFTAICLLGRSGDNIYVLDGQRGRWAGNLDKIEAILEMAWDWRLVYGTRDPENDTILYRERADIWCNIFAEEINYQVSLAADWNSVVQDKYQIYTLMMKPVKAKGDKSVRLKGTTGLFQTNRLFWNKWKKKALTPFVQELLDFGAASHDDCADAFAYGANGIRTGAPLSSA
jgi:phage terminase large subunit-like protein